jgi:hypothetical protein
MGIQHEENVPDSFVDAFDGDYLGDPDVVASLVGEFCAGVENLMNGGASSPKDFNDKANALVRRLADVFSGRDSAYTGIPGYNEVRLPAKLRVDLGEFWTKQRAKWDDDPVCVFFEWLFVHVAESVKRADGDDMLLGVMLKPTVQQAVKVLLGIEQRQW